jgi:long-chain acyl-CoA synthetase
MGIATRNSLEAMVSMIGLWALGATAVHIDFRARAEEKKRLSDEFELAAILEDHRASEASHVSIVLDGRWNERVEQQSGDPLAPPSHHAPAVITLTSGTTGRPIGIVASHENLLLRYMMHIQEGLHGRGLRYLSAIPLSNAASRNHCLIRLLDGATIHFLPSLFGAAELADAALSVKATSIFVVPTVLRELIMLNRSGQTPLLPDLEMMFLAGAFTAPDEKREAIRLVTPQIYEIYSSVICGNISLLRPEEMSSHGETVGRVFRHVRLEIVDEHDRPLPHGEAGLLRACSPGMPNAIYGDKHRVSGDRLRDGWAYPGDIASLDLNGYVRILGRSSEVIIRGGVNVHPSEIESVVAKLPGVIEAAAVGYPSKREGEEIAVFVIAAPGIQEDTILSHCRRQMLPDKCPRRVILVNEFPRSHAGKILRKELANSLVLPPEE